MRGTDTQPDDFRLDKPTPFAVVPRGKGGWLAAIPLVGEGLKAAQRRPGLRPLVLPECEQGAGAGCPEGGSSDLLASRSA